MVIKFYGKALDKNEIRKKVVSMVTETYIDDYSWVYVLKCDNPNKDRLMKRHETFFTKKIEEPNYDDIPDWAWAAFYSDSIYYVGSTNDIVTRLNEHYEGTTLRKKNEDISWTDTKFTKYFPIDLLVSLEKCLNLTMARRKEKEKADGLKESFGDVFVFQY